MPFETDKGGGFKIDASDLLKTGVYPERFDRQIPFWETVNGVQYTEFGMRRKAGREELSEGQETFTSLTSNVTQVFSDMPFTIFINPNYSAYVFYLYVKFDIPFPGNAGDLIKLTGFANIATNILFTQTEKDWFDINKTWTVDQVITTGIYANSVKIKVADTFNDDDFNSVEDPNTYEPLFPYSAYPTGWPVSNFVLDGGQTAGYRSATTSTAVRGITATREYEDRVCYFGDLTSIKSYREITQATALVGTGYNLLQSSAATTWDVSSTSWDIGLGVTVWDSAVNESDQWDFETFGSFVVGAKGSSKPVIKKNNVNFNTFHNDQVSGATVTSSDNPGSSYIVGQLLTVSLVAPTGGTGLTATVTKVDATKLVDFEITNFGSGYANGDVVTFSSTGTAATATLTVPNIDFDSLECFHRQGPHMLAFNYTKGAVDYSTSFAWCSADNLDDWVGAAINTAGSLLIREAETPIRCVCQLGNGLAVYTDTQMFVVNYVGLPNIFGYQVALEGSVGAVSPNSVISVGRKNYGVSRDGFFVQKIHQ
tara:strand:- start:2714 stop:4330 length:1617 start_codon:yes stop_codon:yes gene_type:complete